MEREITREGVRELDNLLDPLEDWMDIIIKDYILTARTHAAVMPRGSRNADEVFEDTYDMGCVIDLLEFFKHIQGQSGDGRVDRGKA